MRLTDRVRPEWEQWAIREDVFAWLSERRDRNDFLFTRAELLDYRFNGERIPLLDTGRGIRNPADFDATLTIMTSAKKVYADEPIDDGMIRYHYRSGDSADNTKLRVAAQMQVPVIYFQQKSVGGSYYAYYPMYVRDDPGTQTVTLAFAESVRLQMRDDVPALERRYAERRARARLHQDRFRDMVLTAYARRCAICRLQHIELLDAAHITPDNAEHSIVHVTNGLALCKIHHAAYDSKFLGISPDYRVHIDVALLDEVDGPMLQHGLKDMHGSELVLPARESEWPSRDRLAERFSEFAA